MPTKPLPEKPNLEHLKHQAKDLMRAHAARDAQALQRIREFHPRFSRQPDDAIAAAPFALADAQLTLAREHGFASWPRLKRRVEAPTHADRLDLPHHERIEDPDFRRGVDLLDAGDVDGLRAHLRAHPDLVHRRVLLEGGNYFREPTLLEFVAENPVRRGTMPPNVVDVARVLLDAGAGADAATAALELVASGRVPREQGAQVPLIDLLCSRGAQPERALPAALAHEEWDAVHALLRCGAPMTLPAAAALGRADDARALLPRADADARHLALALAAQTGHAEVVRLLLDAGVDPSRYNPVGAHAHSTPLHQAALRGHADVARLLLDRGADATLRDTLWQGTPLEWALHAKREEMAALLRQREPTGAGRR